MNPSIALLPWFSICSISYICECGDGLRLSIISLVSRSLAMSNEYDGMALIKLISASCNHPPTPKIPMASMNGVKDFILLLVRRCWPRAKSFISSWKCRFWTRLISTFSVLCMQLILANDPVVNTTRIYLIDYYIALKKYRDNITYEAMKNTSRSAEQFFFFYLNALGLYYLNDLKVFINTFDNYTYFTY